MPIMLDMTLGEKIRELRTAKEPKWSQDRLARESGLTASQIQKIEQGVIEDPSWSTIRALAKALDVPVAELDVEAGSEEKPKRRRGRPKKE